MDPLEKSRQREKQVAARLHLAITRLKSAQQERIWAIAAAQAAGLSIRKIAAATGLSPSRIHQLLKNQEASEIPAWLSQLRELLQDSEYEVSFKASVESPHLSLDKSGQPSTQPLVTPNDQLRATP